MPSSIQHYRPASPPREAVLTLEKIIKERVPQAPARQRGRPSQARALWQSPMGARDNVYQHQTEEEETLSTNRRLF